MRLDGRFTVREGAEGQLFLWYEAGGLLSVSLLLNADRQPMTQAQELAKTLNVAIAAIEIDELPV